MRIVEAALTQVRLPLVRSFETSSHRKSHLEHLLVRLTDDAGHVGWGEIASPSDPFYCADTTVSCWYAAETYLLPGLVGLDLDDARDGASVWSRVRGHEFARAGVDMALWVLEAQRTGRPLAELVGGTRTEVSAGVSLGIEPTIEALLESVGRHVAQGYARVKLKIAPGWDLEPVRAVREEFGDIGLQVDANGVYPDEAETYDLFKAMDAFEPLMIEQPFAPRDFVSSARLQALTSTPICLDEAIVDIADVHTMLALGAGRIVNIKVSRLGGVTPAVAVHDLCLSEEVPVWCGGMHEFGIGRLVNVAVSAQPGFSLPSDVSASAKYYARDIVVPEVVAPGGLVAVPTSAGLGHEVDTDWIDAHTVRTRTFA
jgi:o-succinylbenzoate synthase